MQKRQGEAWGEFVRMQGRGGEVWRRCVWYMRTEGRGGKVRGGSMGYEEDMVRLVDIAWDV